MTKNEQWLKWAVELQSLAQAGLFYTKDVFDRERFERIREMSAEMISYKTDIPLEKVKDLFCNETGYQTPKLDTRVAIFKDDRILLVQERDGRWNLPGGWCDVDLSVKENAIKEAREEAGLNVTADLVIAIQNHEMHNLPIYAFKICTVFVLCSVIDGAFVENIETTASGYFSMEDLPPLSREKTNEEQLEMCFAAYHAKNWKTLLD